MVIDTHTGQNRQVVGAILAVVGDDVVLIAGTAVHTDGIVTQETVDQFLTIGVGTYQVAPT